MPCFFLSDGTKTRTTRCEPLSVPVPSASALNSYVPSKVDLGAAAKTKRPTSCVMITPPRETKEYKWDENTRQLFNDLKEVCIQEMRQVPT